MEDLNQSETPQDPQLPSEQSGESHDGSETSENSQESIEHAEGASEAGETPSADSVGFQTKDAVPAAELEHFQASLDRVRNELAKVIVGQDKAVDLLLTGLLSGGHVLLEGVPGIAKTLTAKLIAKSLTLDFSRIQFTPDLMPSDVIGTSVFNLQNSEFNFKRGPIFANLVLIDEINRSPAKTQAALFEVMEEQQITHDGTVYPFSEPFMVIATQNPIEQEGTYRLPEAQLDRFLFRIRMQYPDLNDEKSIIRRFRNDFQAHRGDDISTILSGEEIMQLRSTVEKVYIKDELCDYIAEIVHATRNSGSLYLGASPRASLSILKTAKAYALMAGRSFVTPDDIQEMCYPVLNHRVLLSSERELEGVETEQVIRELIQSVDVPR